MQPSSISPFRGTYLLTHYSMSCFVVTCLNMRIFVFVLFQCKWFKGKTEIKNTDSMVIEQEGLTHRLIIHTSTVSDTGKYKCTFDDQSTFCNLTVRGIYSACIVLLKYTLCETYL